MKQYVIDELRPEDYGALKKHLDEQFGHAEMDGIYWIPVATELLTDIQLQHEECRPHFLALDLDQDLVRLDARNGNVLDDQGWVFIHLVARYGLPCPFLEL